MKTFRIFTLFLHGILCAMALPLQASTYTAAVVDFLPAAMNASGQVVGSGGPSSSGEIHAFLYSNGHLTDLGTLPGGDYSEATGINVLGQIVGRSTIPSGDTHAFLYSNGAMKDLGVLPGGGSSGAAGINDAGQIVGWSSTTEAGHVYPSPDHAFLYANDQMTDLGSLGSTFAVWSSAAAINNAGQIVGWSNRDGGGAPHAFLYSGGSMTDLGTLGGEESRALGINNLGQVVGFSYIAGNTLTHAFLYAGAVMTDLGTAAGTSESTASGINGSSQIVGSCSGGPSGELGFVYSVGRGMTDLNTLIPSGWAVSNAYGINDSGRIIGFGSSPDQFGTGILLSPAPIAKMLTPAPGSTLASATTTFSWDAGTGVSQYALWVGSTPNSSDLYSATGTVRSRTLTLPADGRTLYVTLRSLIGGTWGANDYIYTAYTPPPAPEIVIEQPAGTSLADGISIIDFGGVTGGIARTFTVRNTGTADLILSSLTNSGGNTGDFVVDDSGMDTTVASGGSTTFIVTFSPAGTGLRSTKLQIWSNDGNESPFDLTLKGTGTVPEIAVSGNTVAIVDGDTTPSAADFTDFGVVQAAGGTLIRTFIIANTGSAALHLGGTPMVEITGPQAAEFTVTADPAAVVAVGGRTTFKITFAPQDLGLRTAMVSIANDDPNEDPYTFAISGVGKDPVLNLSAVAGSYNGLVKASALLPAPNGTAPGVSTEGFFTAAVLGTGAFTGKLTLDGLVLSVAGAFDHAGVARFGTNLSTELTVARPDKPSLVVALNLNLTPPPGVAGKLTGTVTQNDRSGIAAVSTVEAGRAYYNGTTLVVPDDYLTVNGAIRSDGIYTAVFAARPPYDSADPQHTQAPGIGTAYYPQGDGIATARISKAGVVSLAGTLADGTALTTTAPLSQEKRGALFVPLYKMGGFISGWLDLDYTNDDSQFSAAGLSWCRPYQDTQHYPFGWPEVIKVDLSAAKYALTAGQSALPGVTPTPSSITANAQVQWSSGLLTGARSRLVNISPGDVVSRVPATDSSFALAITRSTGLLSGSFTHSNGTKPSFQGVIYQKGALSGGHGFFLTTAPAVKDYTGQSGVMTLAAHDEPATDDEFSVTASFTESYRQTLVATFDPGMGMIIYEDVPSGSTTFTVVGTLNQAALPAYAEETPVGVDLGMFSHSATLGEASSLSLAGRRAVYYLTEPDPNDPNGIREIRIGTITYTWTSTSFTVTGSLALDAGSVAATNYEGIPGPVADLIPAALTFDLVTGSRIVHVKGNSSPTTRVVGDPPEDHVLANVSISGSTDYARPQCAISSPASAARILASSGPDVTCKGSASDGVELAGVELRLNGSAPVTADLVFNQIGKDEFGVPILSTTVATWSANVAPVPGPNVLEAVATDGDGNESVIARRSFQYVLPSPLQVTPDGQGTLTFGFSGSTQREVGTTYTVTATPKASYVFDHWTVSGGPTLGAIGVTAQDLERPTLRFIFEEGLVLTATFISNPFVAAVTGGFNGLILPSSTLPAPGASKPGIDTVGMVTATVTTTGALSGKLLIDGMTLSFAGVFDNSGTARFGTQRATTFIVLRPTRPNFELELHLGLDPAGTNKLTGTLTQRFRSVVESVSTLDADRACYNGTTTKVPGNLAGTTSKPYTAVFPAKVSQGPGFTAADYPQGDGCATVSVSINGTVALAGNLADGTVITASAPLSKTNTWTLFKQLYSVDGVMRGGIAGRAALDDSQPDIYVVATDLLWFRPFQMVQWYPYGWDEGILVDLAGAEYVVPPATPATSVFPGPLAPVDPLNGNVELSFSEGLLTGPITLAANIGPTNLVTKPASNADANFTLGLTPASGLITGTFTHTNLAKTAFKGIIIQKGTQQGAHGWFLSTAPRILDYAGEGGAVNILAR